MIAQNSPFKLAFPNLVAKVNVPQYSEISLFPGRFILISILISIIYDLIMTIFIYTLVMTMVTYFILHHFKS